MFTNTILSLVIISLSGFFRLRMRYDRILSWIMLFIICILFHEYTISAMQGHNFAFSFLWNSSKIGDITIDFQPLYAHNQQIIPIFFLSVISILNNNIFRNEEKKSSFNSLIILNFVSLSLLICSENYMQLITSVFISDILGYLLIKNVDSSHRYVIYNFLADMCLFMILAMVCGKINSLAISQLLTYEQIGRHKDFVGIVTTLALCIKMGLFPFHNFLIDLSSNRFQRMEMINLLFAPLSGILLLLKIHNLLTVSDVSIPMLKIIVLSGFTIGVLNMILKDNIQKKIIFLNMAFMSMILWILINVKFSWQPYFSYYFILIYFLDILFFKIYLYQNRETRVSEMLNSKEVNSLQLKIILIQIAILVTLFLHIGYLVPVTFSNMMSVIWVIGIGIILNHIYKSPNSRRLEYLPPNRLRSISFLFNSILLIYGCCKLNVFNIINLGTIFFFFVLISLPFFYKFCSFYHNSWLQETDLSRKFFLYTLISPLMHISRNLWMFVDFVVSEKIITSGLALMNRISISLFFKINRKNYFSNIMYIILGILIFVVSFYRSLLP